MFAGDVAATMYNPAKGVALRGVTVVAPSLWPALVTRRDETRSSRAAFGTPKGMASILQQPRWLTTTNVASPALAAIAQRGSTLASRVLSQVRSPDRRAWQVALTASPAFTQRRRRRPSALPARCVQMLTTLLTQSALQPSVLQISGSALDTS